MREGVSVITPLKGLTSDVSVRTRGWMVCCGYWYVLGWQSKAMKETELRNAVANTQDLQRQRVFIRRLIA